MSFLIDPFTQQISDVDAEIRQRSDFLQAVRELIGSRQPNVVGLAHGALAMFVDSFGLLRGESQRFWRFMDGPERAGGKALVVRVDASTGQVGAIDSTTLPAFQQMVIFEPDIRLLRIEESLLCAPGQVPQFYRVPVFSDQHELNTMPALMKASAALPEPPEVFRWVLQRRQPEGYRAVRYVLQDEDLRPTEVRTAPTLEELRELLPSGLEFVPPGDDDPEDIIEYARLPEAQTEPVL